MICCGSGCDGLPECSGLAEPYLLATPRLLPSFRLPAVKLMSHEHHWRIRLPHLVVLVWISISGGCLESQRGSMANLDLPLMTASEQSAKERWAGWRGGSRHGISDSVTVPLRWTNTSGVRWRSEVPGRGASSPVLWGDRVFLTSAMDSNDLVLFCIDLADGEHIWQRSLGNVEGRTHRKNGYASATVAVDGRRVYVPSAELGFFCFSMEGHPLWHTSLGTADHPWGAASSPVIYGDLVIQLCDNQSQPHLVAMNGLTGDVVWSVPRESEGNWTTPILIKAKFANGERDELIVNGTGSADGSKGSVISYDPLNGQQHWRVRGTTGIPCPTLVAAKDLVISASGGNGPIIAIRPGGEGDVTESRIAWRHSEGGAYVPTGIGVGDFYYSVSDNGIVGCWKIEDGTRLWTKRLGGTFSASLVAADGRVYAVSEQGDVHVFSASDEFEALAVNRMGEQPCLATPSWASGELLLRTSRHLYCIAGEEQQLTAAAGEVGAEEAPSSAKASSVHSVPD